MRICSGKPSNLGVTAGGSNGGPRRAVIGRLAPSPTGAQHIGNARTYLLAWLSVRSQGGTVVLRIEDIDSPRVKVDAAQQAVDDLRWLGLDWDEGFAAGGDRGPYLQSQRVELYQQALDTLKQAEKIYPCSCSRTDVAAAASAPHMGQDGPVYPGICIGRRAADAAQLGSRLHSWRFRASNELRTISDLVMGQSECRVGNELGDFVIAKADGSPAYQLAVVIDDHAMGVTEVLLGDDLLPSAFRQLELFDFFAWSPPVYAHVPLVIGPDGRRLAKRHGDTRLSVLRQNGVSPERLVGLLAWSCGLQPTAEPVSARELISNFSLAKLPKQPFTLTEEMWQRLNV